MVKYVARHCMCRTSAVHCSVNNGVQHTQTPSRAADNRVRHTRADQRKAQKDPAFFESGRGVRGEGENFFLVKKIFRPFPDSHTSTHFSKKR